MHYSPAKLRLFDAEAAAMEAEERRHRLIDTRAAMWGKDEDLKRAIGGGDG